MKFPTLIALPIFFFTAHVGFGQDSLRTAPVTFPDSTLRVSNIIIIGNQTTKEYVIQREMSLTMGSLITKESIDYDINRIYSLRLFNKVDIQVIPDSTTAALVVLVSERWYFYPFPILGIKDHNFERFYYGAGVAHTNFRGRAEQVFAQFALGYDPFVSLDYVNPLIYADRNLFFSTKFFYSILRNRSLLSLAAGPNFDERHVGGQVGLGTRFSLFSTLGSAFGYESINVTNNKAGRTLSASGTDEFFLITLSYRYDTRDLSEYSRLGTVGQFNISKYGLGTGDVDYQRYSFDFRRYIPMYYDIVFAGRMFGNFSSGGAVPNYGHVFLGYGERIRGRFRTILEGEQILGGTAELHLPLVGPSFFRVEQIPIEQFRDIRYALYLALFADAGEVWYRSHSPARNHMLSGVGFGFHFLLSYSFVARIEYAFGSGLLNQGELIFDLGAAL